MSRADLLYTWTIYQAPSDFPGVPFVVRQYAIGPHGQVAATGALGFADTLEQARGYLPPGLVRFDRAPEDDEVIVESWM